MIEITPKNIFSKLEKGTAVIGIAPENFGKVVFITEIDREATIGFVLNDKLEHTYQDIFPDKGLCQNIPIYRGGNNTLTTLHILHSDITYGGTPVGNIYWGGEYSLLQENAKNFPFNEKMAKLFVGFSCWYHNTLQNEILLGKWYNLPITNKEIFSENPFRKLAQKMGIFGQLLINEQPLKPELN